MASGLATDPEQPPGCGCFRCTAARVAADPNPEMLIPGVPVALHRMFLCGVCGNKRCPKSDDHRNSCTASNDPGQLGSRYE